MLIIWNDYLNTIRYYNADFIIIVAYLQMHVRYDKSCTLQIWKMSMRSQITMKIWSCNYSIRKLKIIPPCAKIRTLLSKTKQAMCCR